MAERKLNVLFVCQGNSARSVMAEALLERFGSARFNAFSAGTSPRSEVHPLTIELLHHHGFAAEKFQTKAWTEFTGPSAPHFDFVISVCEHPGDEVWNAWPRETVRAHWHITDPVAIDGSQIERVNAFRRTFRELENRIKLFTLLRHDAVGEPSRAA